VGQPANTDPLQRVSANDWLSLARALTDIGMAADDIATLQKAFCDRATQGQPGLGPDVQRWLAGLRVQCAHGICSVNKRVLVEEVEPMLRRYVAR
jgi:hypothetical protein